jgi:hypothetical protein
MMEDSFMKSYMKLIPQPDELSNIVFWSQEVLNEIDSDHLKHAHANTHSYYRSLYDLLVGNEKSPYREKHSLSIGEFMWALNTVSSRHIVMHQ